MAHIVVVRSDWIGECMKMGQCLPGGVFRLSNEIGCEQMPLAVKLIRDGKAPIVPTCQCNVPSRLISDFAFAKKWREGRQHSTFIMAFYACPAKVDWLTGVDRAKGAGCDFFQWKRNPLELKPPSAACAYAPKPGDADEEMLRELRLKDMNARPQGLDAVRPSSRWPS
jgi:hypothetical protein